jgi:hypothetical protein
VRQHRAGEARVKVAVIGVHAPWAEVFPARLCQRPVLETEKPDKKTRPNLIH